MAITALRRPAASAPVHDVREGELCLRCAVAEAATWAHRTTPLADPFTEARSNTDEKLGFYALRT